MPRLRNNPIWSQSRFVFPALLFIVLLVHGALLGLTDDEAYYWVLAQKPALGYAFHPPAVAWSIWLPQKMLSWIFGVSSPGLVRLPAAFFSASILALGLYWLKLAGVADQKIKRGGWVLISFAGMYGASWMMVPDLPLIFGWMLLFVSTWKFCTATEERFTHFGLFAGSAILLLSKYSGILAIGSAGLSVLLLAKKSKRPALSALILGAIAAVIPVVIWNYQHNWASILYQIRDRHGDAHFSAMRWIRFWAIEMLLAGPVLFYTFGFIVKSFRDVCDFRTKYILIWMLPAFLIFCMQPAWSEFKPHWALVVWVPVFLELAFQFANGRDGRWAKAQIWCGLPLIVIGLLFCHFPLLSYFSAMAGKSDPKIDVTNDMYGWDKLRDYVLSDSTIGNLPIIGSRYQTSSQAAFIFGKWGRVSFLPRDLKQRDEWPNLSVSDGQGPLWPRLTSTVLFVADNRYDAGPEFADARCDKIKVLETERRSFFGVYPAKRLTVWECFPYTRN